METSASPKQRQSISQFYSFIEELASIRTKTKTAYKDAVEHYMDLEVLREPLHGIKLDTTTPVDFLCVERPDLPKCPEPDKLIIDWIPGGWQDARRAEIKPYAEKIEKVSTPEGEIESVELFESDPIRKASFSIWSEAREEWRAQYEVANKVTKIYQSLDSYKLKLDREGHRVGCFVANGFVRSEDGSVEYPILMQRAYIVQDVNGIRPVIRVSLNDELIAVQDSILRQANDSFNFDAVTALRESLEKEMPNILSTDEIRPLLSKFAASLSTKCVWRDQPSQSDFNEATKLIFYPKPMIFIASLPNGVKEAVGKIKTLIEEGEEIPSPIRHLLCGFEEGEVIRQKDGDEKPNISERLAMIGGESEEVLLSLPANREQLEIAKMIRQSDAVLVQGPPGTGKTHTIANLLGDMLASGKRVLVTSTTDKALTVLRDKLPEEVRPLCVTLLDQNGSSTESLKTSVEGICSTIQSPAYSESRLSKQSESLQEERAELMKRLASNRRRLYEMCKQESAKVTCNGRDQTLSKWAAELQKHEEDVAYLPDSNLRASTFNVPMDAIGALLRTNVALTAQDDKALSQWMPVADEVPTPEEVQQYLDDVHDDKERQKVSGVIRTAERRHVTFAVGKVSVTIEKSKVGSLKIKDELAKREILPWMHDVMLAGMGSQELENTSWGRLLGDIKAFVALCDERNNNAEVLSRNFEFKDSLSPEVIKETARWYVENGAKGKIGFLKRLTDRKNCQMYEDNLSGIRINGQTPNSPEMFKAVIEEADFLKVKADLAEAWNGLVAAGGGRNFSNFGSYPEREIIKFINPIEMCLNWWNKSGAQTYGLCDELGISKDLFPNLNEYSTDDQIMSAVWQAIRNTLIPISEFIEGSRKTAELVAKKSEFVRKYTAPLNEEPADIVELLREAALSDASDYAELHRELCRIQSLRPIWEKRQNLLGQIRDAGGIQWANKIANREDGWTDEEIVQQAEKCLYWREVQHMLCKYYGQDYSELQAETVIIARDFRKKTAELAAVRSWLHLQKRLSENPNVIQDLNGWVSTVSKIGKGTGKQAKRHMVEAQRKAKECQKAVPIWIMTIQRALLTLDPKEKFDVIIVDEASQSDVTGLAVLYMGKRIIVVGDDKQVSPMGVGVAGDDINSIRRMYLENQGIRNDNLYDETTSIYDIVKTISSPVMLKEHFRCVPPIINFSNWLSYNGKIKPLRDESKVHIRPFMVNHRVANGRRGENKDNVEEAYEIAALIRSCMDQPEYKGKTYGVISMLSGAGHQVARIEKALATVLTPKQRADGRIAVGTPADFQGDERDVIFLSMVQSQNEAPGKPMRKEGDGKNESTKKRYNVAVSRARDQLWVVHSFDPDNELQADDIRKRLISHVRKPQGTEAEMNAVVEHTESPFEKSVARDLIARGYKLIPQYHVGAYRLDFVVKGGKSAALECDGERYHSSSEAIESDMERQAVLERCGWSFVRIRGGEYYRNPVAAIDRVCETLDRLGVKPNYEIPEENPEESELMNRICLGAQEVRKQYKLVTTLSDQAVYETAADIENFDVEFGSSSPVFDAVSATNAETVKPEEKPETVNVVPSVDTSDVEDTSEEVVADGEADMTEEDDSVEVDAVATDEEESKAESEIECDSQSDDEEVREVLVLTGDEEAQGNLFESTDDESLKPLQEVTEHLTLDDKRKLSKVEWKGKGRDVGLKGLNITDSK